MEIKKKKQFAWMFGLIGIIIIVDQIVKIWVKTHMHIGETIPLIGDWCMLNFVENEGFAFGLAFGGTTGKVILSLFRIVASGALLWFLITRIRKGIRWSLLLCLTLVTAGAIGNLIDCCFYGLIFNESSYSVAQMFPPEGGYAPILQGKVVDMFFFPLFTIDLPQWLPFWGGNRFEFFDAIFNIADAAITVGAIWLIIDQLVKSKKDSKKKQETAQNEAQNDEKKPC